MGIPTPEGTIQQIRRIRRHRSRSEEAQELRAYRTNMDKFIRLRAKDNENWYKNRSINPPQVCFLGFLYF